MDVMGDKATLLETGRFVQPADFVQPTGDFAQPTDSASLPVGDLAQPEGDFAFDRPTDRDEAGDAAEEARQRLAAEAGDAEAMSVLGAMLLRRGDLDGAEPHLRAATAAGDRAAANNLGVLLHQRG
ncbi:sel1 repeat family protein, partial [Streptomyces sp. T21Q-yed]|nr:sel1 repeat family protein [Streptomyces sp. T21Q-yed]